MRRITRVLVLAALLIPFPLAAENRFVDLTLWASWIDLAADDAFDNGDLEFDSTLGYGVGLNVFVTPHFSLDFTASSYEADSAFRRSEIPTKYSPDIAFPGGGVPLRGIEVIPVTGAVQYHFSPGGKIDPYIGGGVSYILLDTENDNLSGVNKIEFDDAYGLMYNVGAIIGLGAGNFALKLDARYVPLDTDLIISTPSGPLPVNYKLNPFTLGAGLTYRF